MTPSVEMYVIRAKGTSLFLCSKHRQFASFEAAILNGVFFNQCKSAEKRVRDELRSLTGGNGRVYERYMVYNDDGTSKYYNAQPTPEADLEYRPIDLEVIPVTVTLKESE